MSQFFVATSILDVSQFVKMLWFMSLYYEILIVVLSLFFSLLLLQPFNFSPVSFACNFQDWGCVILREIDFLLKICWSIPCLYPSWKVPPFLHHKYDTISFYEVVNAEFVNIKWMLLRNSYHSKFSRAFHSAIFEQNRRCRKTTRLTY